MLSTNFRRSPGFCSTPSVSLVSFSCFVWLGNVTNCIRDQHSWTLFIVSALTSIPVPYNILPTCETDAACQQVDVSVEEVKTGGYGECRQLELFTLHSCHFSSSPSLMSFLVMHSLVECNCGRAAHFIFTCDTFTRSGAAAPRSWLPIVYKRKS